MCIRDRDVSVIDELPPGRKDIVTKHRTENHRMSVNGFIRDEIAKGRQIYVVFPLIEAVSYTHLRAHETVLDIVCRLLLEKKKKYNLSLIKI